MMSYRKRAVVVGWDEDNELVVIRIDGNTDPDDDVLLHPSLVEVVT